MTETIAKLERTSQASCNQICQKQTLEYGIAYYATDFPDAAQLNQYREVIAGDAERVPSAMDEADTWFAEQGLRCRRVAMADGSSPDALSTFLESHDYRRQTFHALALRSWGDISVDENVRVLPARAMRPALRATFDDAPTYSTDGPALHADIVNERMDDAAYDMHVALVDGKPAGRCGLYQVGDIARLVECHALPGERQAAVLESLVAHSLALTTRLSMQTICVRAWAEDSLLLDLYRRAGFEQDGTLYEFERAASR